MEITLKNYKDLEIQKLNNQEFYFCGNLAITRMALVLGAISLGESKILNCTKKAELVQTIQWLQRLGVEIEIEKNSARGEITVQANPKNLEYLDSKYNLNSEETAHYLIELLIGYITENLGDEIPEIGKILSKMGFSVRNGKNTLEIKLSKHKKNKLKPVTGQLQLNSAAFKATWFLAGLFADGQTVITEKLGSWDYPERLLMWWNIPLETWGRTQKKITVANNCKQILGKTLVLSGDLGEAAPLVVLATLLPDCRLIIKQVNLNPTISGFIEVLQEMGGKIIICNQGFAGYEPIADLIVESSQLVGVTVESKRLPALVEQLPLLAVAAIFAEGETTFLGVDYYTSKGFDEILGIVKELQKLGGKIDKEKQALTIEGTGNLQGGAVNCGENLRLASALAVAAILADGETILADCAILENSDFGRILQKI